MKLSIVSTLATILLCAGAVAVVVDASCDRNSPEELLGKLNQSADETTCVQMVFPLIVSEITEVSLLHSFRFEDMVTVGDTISGTLGSRLGMRITYHLALNVFVDLNDFGADDVVMRSEEGSPLEITIYLPQPAFSPVEVIETIEHPLYTRNTDNSGEDIALMREYLLQNAKSTFQMNAMEANALGRAKQSAAETIQLLVEGILANHGISAAVRVEFGRPRGGTQFSPISTEDAQR